MRGISTVLDVAICLLLISAAVGTLALAPAGGADAVTVDEQANRLAATTADLEYTYGGSDRRAHGTVASLLARAALANVTVDDQPVTAGPTTFGEQLRSITRARVDAINRTQVVVCWEPYRGAPLRGTYRLGPSPPPHVDVSVGTVLVPTPAPAVRAAAQSRTGSGYREVATVVARATVETLLPESRLVRSAAPGTPQSERTMARMQTLAAETGASAEESLSADDITRTRTRLVDRLTGQFARDMRERFASPSAAAAAIRTGTVRVVVRRWEP
jgi:hypothetical protein